MVQKLLKSSSYWLLAALTLCLLFAAPGLQAQEPSWFIGDHAIPLERCPRGYCRIYCPDPKACLALRYHSAPLRGELDSGGSNPGASVCRQREGRVSILRDPAGNEMAVCRFHDDSMISVDGLWIW